MKLSDAYNKGFDDYLEGNCANPYFGLPGSKDLEWVLGYYAAKDKYPDVHIGANIWLYSIIIYFIAMKQSRLSFKQVKTAIDAFNAECGLTNRDKGFIRLINDSRVYELVYICNASGGYTPFHGTDGSLKSCMSKLEDIKLTAYSEFIKYCDENVWEMGKKAFADGLPNDKNPFDPVFENHHKTWMHAWFEGYHTKNKTIWLYSILD